MPSPTSSWLALGSPPPPPTPPGLPPFARGTSISGYLCGVSAIPGSVRVDDQRWLDALAVEMGIWSGRLRMLPPGPVPKPWPENSIAVLWSQCDLLAAILQVPSWPSARGTVCALTESPGDCRGDTSFAFAPPACGSFGFSLSHGFAGQEAATIRPQLLEAITNRTANASDVTSLYFLDVASPCTGSEGITPTESFVVALSLLAWILLLGHACHRRRLRRGVGGRLTMALEKAMIARLGPQSPREAGAVRRLRWYARAVLAVCGPLTFPSWHCPLILWALADLCTLHDARLAGTATLTRIRFRLWALCVCAVAGTGLVLGVSVFVRPAYLPAEVQVILFPNLALGISIFFDQRMLPRTGDTHPAHNPWALLLPLALPTLLAPLLASILFCCVGSCCCRCLCPPHGCGLLDRRDRIRKVGVHECGAPTATPLASISLGATAGGASKFTGDARNLVLGEATDAVRGVLGYLGLDEEAVRRRMAAEGAAAIEQEIRTHGSADDVRWLDAILHGEALEVDEASGEPVLRQLAHFIHHPRSRAAGLSRAHVLALRLYTTPVYHSINRMRNERSAYPFPCTIAFISDGIKHLRPLAGERGDAASGGPASPPASPSSACAPTQPTCIACGEDTTTSAMHASLLPTTASVELADAPRPPRSASLPSPPSVTQRWLDRAQELLLRAELWYGTSDCWLPGWRAQQMVVRRARKRLAAWHDAHGGSFECWRGLRDLVLTGSFLEGGGSEIAPLSTTSSLDIAVTYLLMQDAEATTTAGAPTAPPTGGAMLPSASGHALLFRLRMSNPLQYGADLRYLSFFASESEHLYPPLTFLKPTGSLAQVEFHGAKFAIIDVEPHYPS